MTFPTTAQLDGFGRADENPLSDGGNWSGPIFSGDGVLEVISGQCCQVLGGGGEAAWATAITGAVEVWAVLAAVDTDPFICACLTGVGGAATGYTLNLTGGFGGELDLFAHGGAGLLASYTGLSVTPGDSIGLSVSDHTLKVWWRSGAGLWTLIGTTTDSTYTDGKIGIGTNAGSDAEPAFTSFGGGATVGVVPPPRHGIMLIATDLTGAVKGDAVGRPLPLRTVQTPQVTVPLSDSRTGQVTVSMYERIAEKITAGDTCMKMYYTNPKGTRVFLLNGIVLQPVSDYDSGTIAVTILDPTERLKRRYLTYDSIAIELSIGTAVSDASVDAYTGGSFDGVTSVYGIPNDGRGLRVMLWDAAGGTVERGGGVPYGLRKGKDDSTPQPAYVAGVPPSGVVAFTATATAGSDTLTNVGFSGATPVGSTIADVLQYMRLNGPGIPAFASVASASGTSIVMDRPALSTHPYTGDGANAFTAEDAIYCQLSRGDCIYDDFQQMVNAQGGLEADWIPVDADFTGKSGDAWSAGQMAELYTSDRIGTDRSQSNTGGHAPVVFVHGLHGVHITHSPDADQLVTYSVQVGPGGPQDPLDQFNKAEMIATGPADTFGYYQSWDMALAAGTGDSPISNNLLANRARAELTGFQEPPDFVTITVDSDVQLPFAYGDDFFLGDTVTVVAHKGFKSFQADMRITSIGVSQVDEDGNCQLQITAVPYLIEVPATSGGV